MAKELQLPVSSHKRNLQSAIKRPDRNELVGCLPGEDAFVVSNAPIPVENPLNAPVRLISIRYFCQNPDHDLSSKVETAPNVIVKQAVKVILSKGRCFPAPLTDIVSGIVHAFQCLHQRLVLLFSRCQFNLSYQFHNSIIAHSSRLDKKGGLSASSAR